MDEESDKIANQKRKRHRSKKPRFEDTKVCVKSEIKEEEFDLIEVKDEDEILQIKQEKECPAISDIELDDNICAVLNKNEIPLPVIPSNIPLNNLEPIEPMEGEEPQLLNQDPNNGDFISTELLDQYERHFEIGQCEESDIRIIGDSLGDGRTLYVRQFSEQETAHHDDSQHNQIHMFDPGELETLPSPRDDDLSIGHQQYQQMDEEDFLIENYLTEKIDIKDLKLLKPVLSSTSNTLRETQNSSHCNYHPDCGYSNLSSLEFSSIKPSQWYNQVPKPLAVNTFQMRHLGGGGYVLNSQRKMIEMRKSLRQDTNYSNNAKTLLNNRLQIFNNQKSRGTNRPYLNGVKGNESSEQQNEASVNNILGNHINDNNIIIISNLGSNLIESNSNNGASISSIPSHSHLQQHQRLIARPPNSNNIELMIINPNDNWINEFSANGGSSAGDNSNDDDKTDLMGQDHDNL